MLQVENVHSAYAKTFEFKPRDPAMKGISTPPYFSSIRLTALGELTLGSARNF